MAAKFIVKEKQFQGTYRNPFCKGGGGMKWGKWKTKSSHATLREALDAAVVRVGLAKRSVFYRGQQVSDGYKLNICVPRLPFGTDVVAWAESTLINESKET